MFTLLFVQIKCNVFELRRNKNKRQKTKEFLCFLPHRIIIKIIEKKKFCMLSEHLHRELRPTALSGVSKHKHWPHTNSSLVFESSSSLCSTWFRDTIWVRRETWPVDGIRSHAFWCGLDYRITLLYRMSHRLPVYYITTI